MVNDRRPLGCVKHSRSKPDQSTGWNGKAKQRVFTARSHFVDFTATVPHHFHDRSHTIRWNFDVENFVRLIDDTVDFFQNNAWLANAHFEAFASHRLDQNGKVKHPASSNSERFASFDRTNAKGNVSLKLFFQSHLQLTRGNVLAIFSGKR